VSWRVSESIPSFSRLPSLLEVLGGRETHFLVAARVTFREEAGRSHRGLAEGRATFFAQGAIG